MSNSYYVRLRGKIAGPFDEQKLLELAKRGQFSRVHEVSSNQQEWQRAGDVFSFFQAKKSSRDASSSHSDRKGSQPANETNANAPSESSWYLAHQGAEVGPMTFAELKQRVNALASPHDASVWRQGFQDWQPANSIDGLVVRRDPLPIQETNSHSQTSELLRTATSSAPWALVTVMLGYVFAAFQIVTGVGAVVLGFEKNASVAIAGGMFTIVFGSTILTGTVLLGKYRAKLVKAERLESVEALSEALGSLKAFWIFLAILIFIAIAFLSVFVIWIFAISASLSGME
ncbi:MAG: DUF4339 domain-containing protein [Pirellulaceae bacterium]